MKKLLENFSVQTIIFGMFGIFAVILAFVILGVPSCQSIKPTNDKTIIDVGVNVGGSKLITVKHSDSCQYVLWDNGYGSNMLHSGNCNNPIHSK